jgi:hypothetical protein
MHSAQHTGPGLIRRCDLGHPYELSTRVEVAIPESRVDGQNFTVAHATHCASLGNAGAGNGDDHVDVHTLVAAGIRQILRGRPGASSL